MAAVAYYQELQAAAEREGRQCVVGALIRDVQQRVFVHRRSLNRRLLPGCWDIVGGHVEVGETLLEALAREIEEETGWTLLRVDDLLVVTNWETTDDGRVRRRREFDFGVKVDGDLTRPRLELGKHVEWRWIGPTELGLLDENRGADGGLVRRVVERAFDAPAPPPGNAPAHSTV